MSESIINVENLSRDFGGKWALKDVSFQLNAGQIMAIVGPNGAGKTTLLKLLRGLIRPSSGTARVLEAGCFPPSNKTASRIGCVLNSMEPPRCTRIRELLALNSAASNRFEAERAALLCREREINLQSYWHRLSKGQKQWVLAAMAISRRPDVLLLDEPADGLDPSARIQLYDLLRTSANDHGTAVVIASHILTDLERVADEVAVFNQGQIKLHAELDDLRDEIREIHISGDTFPTDILPAGATLLGFRVSEPVTIGWVRFAHRSDATKVFPGEINRRSANLQTIYLAMTDHAWQPPADQPNDSTTKEPAHV